MKALVTGGGFLGQAIAALLLGRGDQVRIFSRERHTAIEKLGAEGVQGDIRDLDGLVKACMGRDAVFHTAALSRGVWNDAALYAAVNVAGTRHVIEACKRRGVAKLLYASAAGVVFDMRDECGIGESAPRPRRFLDLYSESKARAEEVALQASGSDGLLACSLRPLLLWGPGDPSFLPRLITSARRGRLRIIGTGRNRAAPAYIDNAAMAHLLACDAMSPKRVAGEAYFISDEEPVIFWDWVNALLMELGLPPARKRLPASAACAIGAFLERAYVWLGKRDEPRMTRFLARVLSCSHYYDLAKAKRDFGYRAVVANDEGLRRTVEYFRDSGS